MRSSTKGGKSRWCTHPLAAARRRISIAGKQGRSHKAIQTDHKSRQPHRGLSHLALAVLRRPECEPRRLYGRQRPDNYFLHQSQLLAAACRSLGACSSERRCSPSRGSSGRPFRPADQLRAAPAAIRPQRRRARWCRPAAAASGGTCRLLSVPPGGPVAQAPNPATSSDR